MHSNFFSSLKQVEKRLKLDHSSPSLPELTHNATESLITPLYLPSNQHDNVMNNIQSSNLEDSEIPVEFLSNSLEFPPTHENPLPKSPQNGAQTHDCAETDVDEIGLLIDLLGLSDTEGDGSNLVLDEQEGVCGSCHCGGGFYDKIVGVKGPKCGKEVERLDGWIARFRKDKSEPFRLAHLLLGKAVFVSNCGTGSGGNSGDGEGFEVVEFPSTVDEFLLHDPPLKSMEEGENGGC